MAIRVTAGWVSNSICNFCGIEGRIVRHPQHEVSQRIDAQRRGIRNSGSGQFLRVVLVRGKKQVEGSSTLYLGIQVPGCSKRQSYLVARRRFKSVRQFVQRVVKVRRGGNGDLLGSKGARSDHSDHQQEQPDLSHRFVANWSFRRSGFSHESPRHSAAAVAAANRSQLTVSLRVSPVLLVRLISSIAMVLRCYIIHHLQDYCLTGRIIPVRVTQAISGGDNAYAFWPPYAD